MAGDKSAQIQILLNHIQQRLDADDPLLLEFARLWWSRIPEEDLEPRTLDSDAPATIDSWRAFRTRDPEATDVHVSNPHAARDGWQSHHTVVRVMMPDMPFVTDSVLMALSHDGQITHHLSNLVLSTRRDAAGHVEALSDSRAGPEREVFIYAEIDRLPDAGLGGLRARLEAALADVRAAVGDFDDIKDRLAEITRDIERAPPPLPADEVEESLAFLNWLARNNFTFLGYRGFDYRDRLIRQNGDQALGVLRHRAAASVRKLEDQTKRAQSFLLQPTLLAFSQSGTRSRVHRPAYPDYIGIRQFDDDGQVVGEHGFLGLFTSRAYLEHPGQIPLVRRKVAHVLDRSGLDPTGFDGKVLNQVLLTFPKDELLQTSEDDLLQTALRITYIHERRRTRLFVRYDPYGLFVHCLIYLPRDRYSTQARLRIQEILVAAYDAEDVEFEPYFSESILVRLQINLRVRPGAAPEVDHRALEARLVEVTRDWSADLQDQLVEQFGESRSRQFSRAYALAFPSAYRERYSVQTAAHDIDVIEQLTNDTPLRSYFYRRPEEDEHRLHLKLFHLGATPSLSDVVATLENMGLRIGAEHPYQIDRPETAPVALLDFDLSYASALDLGDVGARFAEAFVQVWNREADDDRFNRLLLAGGLGWRQINVLRTYARYMKQIRFVFSMEFISDTLCKHHTIAAALVDLFERKFDPERDASQDLQAQHAHIERALDDVALLNEDRILRRYLELIDATLRVNHYRTDPATGRHRPYLSLKFAPAAISELPKPAPAFEIFVSSPRMEGVHLRGGPIARGGLRWSDRAEDYRTEVLGLMKAQKVKNAVIVPTGAKGGFIVRAPSDDPDTFRAQGIECYQEFIRGLLDLTDNVIEGRIEKPPRVRCHDGDDPYLVVAADKGTASFSDTANAVAESYAFWLGDAFASGGSNGYDHKRMGITARGAWISVQRHFAERGVDVQTDPITVLGIGDMAGDVFGNGMLRSRSLLLVAAFNHRHIFIDPDPEPEAAFEERQRLYDLPRSSWSDYDTRLISAGGGVFERTAKRITITPEMQRLFDIDAAALSPDELIHRLLKAPVDLIWNGGIGTYVKAAAEGHADAGDRANDNLRVDAEALRCRVIGEGGNLGVTQRARVAFARAGGAINTDFVDNSAGVDCSDREVNIKIALNQLVADGELTRKHRNALLKDMTEAVAQLVLTNNFRQAQVLSLAERQVRNQPIEYRRFIGLMEQSEGLDRGLEGLPGDEQLADRAARGESLTRPELAVLMAFSKTHIKTTLDDTGISDDPAIREQIFEPFPEQLTERFPAAISNHRLARQLVSTQLANDLVHHMGITFVTHLMEFAGTSVEEILRAYLAAAACFRLRERFRALEALEGVDDETRLEALAQQVRLGRRATRWLLRHERTNLDVAALVSRYRDAIDALRQSPAGLLRTASSQARREQLAELEHQGVAEETARLLTGSADLANALTLVAAANRCDASALEIVDIYGALGQRLELEWLLSCLIELQPSSHWQNMERDSLIDDMTMEQARLAAVVHHQNGGDLEAWLAANPTLLEGWKRVIDEARRVTAADFSLYAITCRKLIDLGKGVQAAA